MGTMDGSLRWEDKFPLIYLFFLNYSLSHYSSICFKSKHLTLKNLFITYNNQTWWAPPFFLSFLVNHRWNLQWFGCWIIQQLNQIIYIQCYSWLKENIQWPIIFFSFIEWFSDWTINFPIVDTHFHKIDLLEPNLLAIDSFILTQRILPTIMDGEWFIDWEDLDKSSREIAVTDHENENEIEI